MRMWSAVLVATAMVAGAASAQMKVPAQQAHPAVPQQPAVAASSSPVVITSNEPTLDTAKRIKRDEAIKMVKQGKAVWIDVRPVEQFNEGHIKGAINIPEFEIRARVNDLPKNKFIITYCA